MNPDVPSELEAICAKAMANRPYARYPSAVDLGEDIQNWMASEPVTAFSESWHKKARRWMSKHRRLSQVGAVVATMILVAAITLSINSYQNHRTTQQTDFIRLQSGANELDVRLHAVAEDLAKDARFMASLPPIQGVIRARADIDGTEDSEAVWQTRLQTIYRGLLDANPNYLSATYLSAAENAEEIVRVERSSSGQFVQVLPQSRLATTAMSGVLNHAVEMKPGDVLVDDTAILRDDDHAHEGKNAPLVLTAAIPIYSEIGGDVFGVVAIETDLQSQINELLATTVEPGQVAYVANSEGTVVVQYSRDRGFDRQAVGKQIGDIMPEADRLFASAHASDQIEVGQQAYGVKVLLDPRHGSSELVIILATE